MMLSPVNREPTKSYRIKPVAPSPMTISRMPASTFARRMPFAAAMEVRMMNRITPSPSSAALSITDLRPQDGHDAAEHGKQRQNPAGDIGPLVLLELTLQVKIKSNTSSIGTTIFRILYQISMVLYSKPQDFITVNRIN